MDRASLQKALIEHTKDLSRNEIALKFKVSNTIICQIKRGDYKDISNAMFRRIAATIGYMDDSWVVVDTVCKTLYTQVLDNAKEHSMVYGFIANAGRGKTQTARLYRKERSNVILLECSEYWNRKTFAQELMRALGRGEGRWAVADMIDIAIKDIRDLEEPLIILDEADKLTDQVFYFFISLYNMLEGHCGIVMSGTPFLENKTMKGVAQGKKGYEEIFSRIGRKFIKLSEDGRDIPADIKEDLKNICIANGIIDEITIEEIINESEGDIRRVKRKVYAEKL